MKNMTKQMVAWMLALVLYLACLCPALEGGLAENVAAGDVVISVESKEVMPGETFSLNINITNNPGILYAALNISFDIK